MIKFCFWAFILYCVFVAFTMEDEEEVVDTSPPATSYSSPDTSGSGTDSNASVENPEDLEFAFAVAWLEVLLPLQREVLNFEESTILFLAEPSSVITRGNYVLFLQNRKTVYENLGNLEPPGSMASLYEPFAVACLDLADDMESLRNTIVNVLIDVETESGFYKFGSNYLPVVEKTEALDQLAIPIMSYFEEKYSNEYIMEHAPHLFE